MSALTAADFDAFFGELYRGRDDGPLEPFPWQSRLVRRILGEENGPAGWPRVLALPTASGKTAAIDVAVFTLACQADASPAERVAPRRIFFVVDRRVIVDEAFERARRLAAMLERADGGVTLRVADRLRRLAGGGELPLAAFELRGGIYRDDAWARTPLQPTVIASTVDQVGSRLLYRGYGVSPRSWPIHAGLAAGDSLVILDEAHCSRPFRETLDAVERFRRWADEPPAAPFATVAMTATPRPGTADEDVFRLGDDDRTHPELRRRLRASKPARLLAAVPGKIGSPRMVRQLCDQAREFADGGARRIAILVNRVATAREIHRRLGDRHGDKVLMIGRMRPWDRDRLIAAWRPYLKASPEREARERPVFVAATQCLEVGADLDFDALVTECASLDALRQRFGRLNRLGADDQAIAAVAVAAESLKSGTEDFVYGTALRETWQWLTEATAGAAEGETSLDFGIDALDATWRHGLGQDPELASRVSPPAPRAPVLLPAHLDLWVQTAPEPAPEPDPAVFLHGADRGAPEVQVCWRRDLELPAGQPPDWNVLLPRWIDTVAQLPPSSAECMPVPLYVVRRWLRGEPGAADELADVEGSLTPPGVDADAATAPEAPRPTVLCWRGPDDSARATAGEMPRPGDTLVIPAALGGWEEFGHIPPDHPVDLGEAAHFERRRRAVLRLHPELLDRWPESPGRAGLGELAERSEATADPDELGGEAAAILASLDDGEIPEDLHDVARELADHSFDAVPHPSGRGWLLRGRRRVPIRAAAPATRPAAAPAETFTSDDDSASATADMTLPTHCDEVGALAGSYAEAAGLPAALAADLRLAGRLHDLGKADPRFQAWLHDGNVIAAQLAPDLLAKSRRMPEDRRHREQARRRAGYPRGSRHELLSVRLAESGPAPLAEASDRELVLHLVASHHGRCRPFAPVVADPEPVEVHLDHEDRRLAATSATGLEAIDSGVAERFWRLVRRYGWWGLALLEAILRLADHRTSEAEEQRAAATGSDAGRRSA